MTYRELQRSSEEDVLSNTLYLFLLMVVFAVIIGGFSFALREYCLTKMAVETAPLRITKFIPKKVVSLKSSNTIESSASEIIGEPVVANKSEETKSYSPLQASSIEIHANGETTPIAYNYAPTSGLPPINLNLELSESSGFYGGSIGNYLNKEFKVNVQTPKLLYSLMELLDIHQHIKVHKWNVDRLMKIDETNFGDTVSRIEFPAMHFETVYDAEKSITSCASEIKRVDMVSGMLSLVNLLCIGSPIRENCNYFVESFATLVLELVESGLLLNYLEQGSELFKEAMVNMLLCFCWSQFSNSTELQDGVKHQLLAWNLKKPNMLNVATIFRLLSNMKLGLRSIDLEETKVDAILFMVCSKLQCNEYLTIMPLIGKVIKITQHESIVVKYYQLTLKVLEKHIDCCMKNYINDDNHDNDIKLIVQEGVGLKRQNVVCHSAYKVYYFILLHGCDIERWLTEVGPDARSLKNPWSGSKHVVPSYRLSTPGSWEFSNETKTVEMKRSPSLQRFEF